MIRTLLCAVTLVFLMGCGNVHIPYISSPKPDKGETTKKMKETDALLSEYLPKVAVPSPSGGFVHHEGLTEVDAWGNFLVVEYSQVNFRQVLTLRSAGPDGKFNTPDDLVRHSDTPNAWNILAGLSGWTWFFLIWGLSVFLAICLYASMHKNTPRKHPKLGLVFILMLGPIALVIYLIKAFAAAGGAIAGSDFSIDFDLGDIDLF